MTAILGMLYQNAPCLLGDVMISSPSPPQRLITLPASGKSSWDMPILSGTHYVTGFRQKLNLIGPHMIVAWSGSRIEAVAAIKHLRNEYQHVDASSLDELHKLFHSVDELGMKETELIGLLTDEKTWSMRMIGDVKYFTTPWGEKAVAAGTGIEHLIGSLAGSFKLGDQDIFQQSLGNAITVASRMWLHDISEIGTELAFGGAYEVGGILGGPVTKVDDILYSTFGRSDQGLGFYPIFKKVDYYEENLILRILHFPDALEKGSTEDASIRPDVYFIPPVDAPSTPISPLPTIEELFDKIPDFNASHFATHVTVDAIKQGQDTYSFALHDYSPENRPIQFQYDGNSLWPSSLTVERPYLNEIEDELLKL